MAGEQHPFPSTLAQCRFRPTWLPARGKLDGGWENVFGSSFDCLVANLQIDENAPHNYSFGIRIEFDVDWIPWDFIINFITSNHV